MRSLLACFISSRDGRILGAGLHHSPALGHTLNHTSTFIPYEVAHLDVNSSNCQEVFATMLCLLRNESNSIYLDSLKIAAVYLPGVFVNVFSSSYGVLSLPISASLLVGSQYVYAILEVYQKLQKYSSTEEKGTFACLTECCISVLAVWDCIKLFDIPITLLIHSPRAPNQDCRFFGIHRIANDLFCFP